MMKIKILSSRWGHDQVELITFLEKVRNAGYDGLDTPIPENREEKKQLLDFLQKHEMYFVAHQHQAAGITFGEFKSSYLKNLQECAEATPLLINSHTGRDYFTLEQNLELIDIAEEFSQKTGITVAHETHRGRVGYSPQMTDEVFKVRKNFCITADFSHWTCVTESMLQNFGAILKEAILRSRHIHARVGFEEGPQVPDPRAPEWKYAVDKFLGWWDEIVQLNAAAGRAILPITPEAGPKSYMWSMPFSGTPLADQFEVNSYVRDLLDKRYTQYRS